MLADFSCKKEQWRERLGFVSGIFFTYPSLSDTQGADVVQLNGSVE